MIAATVPHAAAMQLSPGKGDRYLGDHEMARQCRKSTDS